MRPLATFIALFLTTHHLSAAGDGVHLKADSFFEIAGLPITNSMITSWVVSLFIIIAIKILVGSPQLVPNKGQIIVESVVSGLRGMLEPIVGKKVFFPSFWLLSGLFIFIIIQNWSGLLPGVGTIGYGSIIDDHFSVNKPLIRPGNADINMTLALSLVANLFWVYFIVKYAGLKAIVKDWFGNKADKKEVHILMFAALSLIFIAVGFIEVLSIVFSPRFLNLQVIRQCFRWRKLTSQHVLSSSSNKLDPPCSLLFYGSFNRSCPSPCFYSSSRRLHRSNLQP